MSGTPLARPDAWRLWWSFTWRQALVLALATVVYGVAAAALNWTGVPVGLIYEATPYMTLAIVVYSGYEACRRLFFIYDIRLKGDHSGEQDHRHRR